MSICKSHGEAYIGHRCCYCVFVLRILLLSVLMGCLQVADTFLGTHYAGVNCGPTVLTTIVHVEVHMLFYTVALPIAEALQDIGVPAFFWFVPTGHPR